MRKIFAITLILALSSVSIYASGKTGIDADVAAAKALTARLLPEVCNKFEFRKEQKDSSGNDCFTLWSENGKIVVSGNSANAMAVGLNHYLKKYCLTTVSWYAGTPITLPAVLPTVSVKEHIAARTGIRFFLNYCTYGYTMPFWQWADWERFIDWMALNGVNMPLAITGQEAVWYNVWRSMGMTDEQVRSYFTGPTYLPWHRMANIDRWNGPLPKSWLDGQVELQKLILKRERELNMRPVLPAFAGHVPKELKEIFPDANIKYLGRWAQFDDCYRCHFLDPSEPLFAKIQKLYLTEQTRLFGTDHIYGVDPFNEVDPPSWEPEYLKRVAADMYSTLTAVDSDAIWLQMTWLFYYGRQKWTAPRVEALLTGVPQDRLLLLDYYCEKVELWRTTERFHNQPYIWCYLGNFGGNTPILGNVKESLALCENTMAEGGKNMQGIGSTLEGLDIQQFPFEEVLAKAWNFQQTDSTAIAHSIADRHFGAVCSDVRRAWEILYNDIYIMRSHSFAGTQQCFRPVFGDKKNWRYKTSYDTCRLQEAWALLLNAPDARHDAFIVDLVVVGREVLGNRFRSDKLAFDRAIQAHDLTAIKHYAAEMTELLHDIDAITACHRHSRLDTWIAKARALGSDSSESDYYERNARNLITTWGGSLNDYSNRSWAGLNGDYYAHRWQMYFDATFAAVKNGENFNQEAFDAAVSEYEQSQVSQLTAGTSRTTDEATSQSDILSLSRRLYAKYFKQKAD